MTLIDSHCHLLYDKMDPPGATMARAAEAGVRGALTINCRIEDEFPEILTVAREHRNIVCSLGTHPHESAGDREKAISEDRIVELARSDPNIVAIGETGLDYYRKFGDRDSQIELFVRQLELAAQLDKPVVIHNREAGTDVLDILSQKIPPKGAVLHCYSENWEYAKKALELPIYISFAGNVTYRNARNLHETAKNMPLERMLIESESPFMVPAAHRGERNRPSYLPETAQFLAELRDIDEEALGDQLYANSCEFFGLEP
mgnify:CR=1 FL=1